MVLIWRFFDTWVRWIAATNPVRKLFPQTLFIPYTYRRLLITGKDCSPPTGHDSFEHCRRKNAWYIFTEKGRRSKQFLLPLKVATTCSFLNCSRRSYVEIPRRKWKCCRRRGVFLEHGIGRHAGGAWKTIHRLRYDLYLVAEGVDFRDVAVFVYCNSMRCDVQKNRRFL